MNDDEKKQGQRNPGASVQARLKNHRARTGQNMDLVLTRYIIERFLYRLSLSPHRERFVLRGAALFAAWVEAPHRPTRDLDLLGTGDSRPEAIGPALEEILAWPVHPPDGVVFLGETLRIEERLQGRIYPGLHVEVLAALGTARPRLEMDLSFGEAITPGPEEIELPALLDLPRPRLLAYSQETVIAEKSEALVQLGLGNTRLKDFFDLWYLSQSFPFDGATLAAALRATFSRRGTAFPSEGLAVALTPAFTQSHTRQSQWSGFLGNLGSQSAPDSLETLVELPPAAAVGAGGWSRLPGAVVPGRPVAGAIAPGLPHPSPRNSWIAPAASTHDRAMTNRYPSGSSAARNAACSTVNPFRPAFISM